MTTKIPKLKIAVVNNWVPFLRGGAELLAEKLCRELQENGHQVELVRVPFRWDTPHRVIDSVLAARMMDFGFYDRVLPIKFPAYCIKHPKKTVWLLHQFRQMYDLWDEGNVGTAWDEARAIIKNVDHRSMTEALKIYCNYYVTADRLERFNQLKAEVLLQPPLETPRPMGQPEFSDFILCLGRINAGKRQHLMVDALAETKSKLNLVIVGPVETDADRELIENKIRAHGLQDRVDFRAGFIPEEEKADLLRRARAVAYLPLDEDCYGYVTLEGFLAGKPLITGTDCGGVTHFVGECGNLVAENTSATALARCIDQLDDLEIARTLGARGYAHTIATVPTWSHVIGKLLHE